MYGPQDLNEVVVVDTVNQKKVLLTGAISGIKLLS
jgi:hypothetical protein